MDFLKISLELKNGICSPKNPINLDALLAYCLVQEEMPTNDKEMAELHNNLPIARYNIGGGDFVWKASQLILTTLFSEARMLTSGINEEHSLSIASKGMLHTGKKGGLNRLIDANTGDYKSFQVFYQVDTLKHCYGFVHGDKDKIAMLLDKHLTHLGAKSSLGSGQIKQIKIEKIDEKDCHWYFRAMPVKASFIKKGIHKVGSIRPPYWKRENAVPLIVPVYI